MIDKRTFPVAMLGLPLQEQGVLKSIFRLSLHRTRAYALTLIPNGVCPDILIIDADNSAAVDEWRALCESDSTMAHVPAVAIARGDKPDCASYHIRRPLVATRVLSVLDQVAINELNYVPEMTIGGSGSSVGGSSSGVAQELDQMTQPANRRVEFRALVVDDSLPVRKQIEMQLQMFGAEVEFAETGERAMELIAQRSYDIIFLDVVLPGVDGYKICKTIKRHPYQRHTPVIMLTGRGSAFDRVRGKLAGCDSYLTKPVSAESFQSVVRQFIPTYKVSLK